jgi:tryptophan synthase alpha chain
VAVGFGVRTASQAAAIGRNADAVVVGTAIVSAIADSLDGDGRATPETLGAVTDLVTSLAQGVRASRQMADQMETQA